METFESRGLRREQMDTSSTVVTGWFLYGMVRFLRPSVIYEIGAYRGHSTAFLALAAKHNVHGSVYAFEPGREIEDAKARVKELVGEDAPVSWHGDVFNATGLPKADFAFLDLDPKRLYTRALDLSIYTPDAIVCAHDLHYEPERATMMDFSVGSKLSGWNLLPLKGERGMAVLTKAVV